MLSQKRVTGGLEQFLKHVFLATQGNHGKYKSAVCEGIIVVLFGALNSSFVVYSFLLI